MTAAPVTAAPVTLLLGDGHLTVETGDSLDRILDNLLDLAGLAGQRICQQPVLAARQPTPGRSYAS